MDKLIDAVFVVVVKFKGDCHIILNGLPAGPVAPVAPVSPVDPLSPLSPFWNVVAAKISLI